MLGTWATPHSLEDAARQAASKQVKDVMHRNLATITEGASIAELSEQMLRRKQATSITTSVSLIG